MPPSFAITRVAVTTSDRQDPALRDRARRAAADAGVPFIERSHDLTLARIVRELCDAAVVFESDAVSLTDAQGTLRFSAGLGHLRVKQLDRGVREDMLCRHAELAPGDTVLDCTVGLAADAQVAARLVGPEGTVIALEKSVAVYLLVRHGLETLPRHPEAARIDVRHADAAAYLAAAPDASVDVVLIDPMFERKRRSSAAFETLRRHADYSELTEQVVRDAQRVARRCVLIKASRYSKVLKRLRLQAEPARPNATVLWVKLRPSR